MKQMIWVHPKNLQPNTWNPNQIPPHTYDKLKANIRRLWEQEEVIPPVIARPSSTEGVFEIIDGEHRWRIFQELNLTEIPVIVLDSLDEAEVKLLTINLNYMKGQPEYERYTELLKSIQQEKSWNLQQLASRIQESRAELEAIISKKRIEDAHDLPEEPEEVLSATSAPPELDMVLNLTFKYTMADYQKIIEAFDREIRNRRQEGIGAAISKETILLELLGVS